MLSERDYLIFEAINRHGPLPATYLYELTRHLPDTKHYQTFQNRLTKLYNGYCANYRTHRYVAADVGRPVLDPKHTCTPVAYLSRPEQQWAAADAKYQPLIYDLAPKAEVVLAEHGVQLRARSDPFLHRLMAACVGASVELGARQSGLVYADQARLFSHPKCPPETRTDPNPLALPLPDGTLIPDDLFGIQRDRPHFFAVEIDRKTESINSEVTKSAYGRKLRGYLHVLRSDAYRQRWGIPNLSVLTVTTNQTHLRYMLEFYDTLDAADLVDRFLFTSIPGFGVSWKVPPVLELLDQPWFGANGKRHHLY